MSLLIHIRNSSGFVLSQFVSCRAEEVKTQLEEDLKQSVEAVSIRTPNRFELLWPEYISVCCGSNSTVFAVH